MSCRDPVVVNRGVLERRAEKGFLVCGYELKWLKHLYPFVYLLLTRISVMINLYNGISINNNDSGSIFFKPRRCNSLKFFSAF